MATTYTIKDMRQIARARGGRCLSEHYINMRQHLTWQCRHNHVWQALAMNVVYNLSWCPTCGHERSRQSKIGKSRLTEELRQKGMARLHAIASSHGGQCLSAEYTGSRSKYRFRCKLLHVWETMANIITNGAWCPQCANERSIKYSLDGLQRMAAEKEGRCLTKKYLGWDTPHVFVCAHSHRWLAKPINIMSGRWCIRCHLNSRRGTLEQMQELAISRGGKCLSTKYINSGKHLLWECHRGHQWRAVPKSVKARTWCPQCAVRERVEGLEHKSRKKRPNY